MIDGDIDAFGILVRKYEKQVASVIYNMVGPVAEAEDIGQEVFIRFFKVIRRFRGDAAVSTYLTRIAINLSLNALKKRKHRRRWVADITDDDLQMLAEENEDQMKFDTDILQQALALLEPKFRAVVVLRFIEGFSTRETAAILRLPQGTVLSRLSRGQDKLKEILMPFREVFFE